MADTVVPHEPPDVYLLPGEPIAAACRRLGVKVQRTYAPRRKSLPDAQVFAPERPKNNAKSLGRCAWAHATMPALQTRIAHCNQSPRSA